MRRLLKRPGLRRSLGARNSSSGGKPTYVLGCGFGLGGTLGFFFASFVFASFAFAGFTVAGSTVCGAAKILASLVVAGRLSSEAWSHPALPEAGASVHEK